MTQRRITDDLHALLSVLPQQIADAVVEANNSDALLEVVLDLGRRPMARFVSGDIFLSEAGDLAGANRLCGSSHRRV